MKRLFLHILNITFPIVLLGQNLVPNSSFEGYTLSTNNTYNQTKFDSCLVNCWVSPTYTDGLNCASLYSDISSFPMWSGSWSDEQLPRTGFTKMMIEQVRGDFTNNLDSSNDIRTYIQTKLIKPLIAGQSYIFKMFISGGYYVPPIGSNDCQNIVPAKNLGVHLSVTRPMGTIGSYDRLDLIPQISFSGIDFYTQPNGWMELTATYIAQGGEEYLTIGNFDYFIDTEYQNGTPLGLPTLNNTNCPINVRSNIAIDDVSLIPLGSTDTSELKLNLGADTTICGPINLTLNADSGFPEYYWSTGETTQNITITQPGTYWCRTQEFCASCADTIVVTQSNFQSIDLGVDTTFCTDGSIQIPLHVNGTFDNYLWSTGETTASISLNSSGLYWVEASYACGIASDTIEITANLYPPSPIVHDTTVCFNTYLIGSAQGTNLLWYVDGIEQDNAPDIPTNNAGTQEVFVSQTVNGCESSIASYFVYVVESPYFELADSIEICSWQDSYVGITNSDWEYLWNDGATYSPRTISEEGFYTLTASNLCGTHNESIEIIKESCDCYFYLPNAFTPNGDPLNSEFKPKFDCYFKDFQMRIFNRWGEIVFSTNDPTEGWDGSFLGSPINDGVYMVQVVYTDRKNSNQEIYNGHVVVIK